MPIISIINDINIFSFQEKRARCSNQCIILAHVLPVSFLVAKCKCKFNMKTSINAKKVSCSMSIAHILLVFIASLGKQGISSDHDFSLFGPNQNFFLNCNIIIMHNKTYRVLFLTVPPDFQYQNEKRWAANQRFCSMKFSMNQRSSLVEQRFSFQH